MLIISKKLFFFILAVVFIISFVSPQSFAEIDHCFQISGQSSAVLSPAVSLNTDILMNSFTNLFKQMKRQTLYTPRDDNKPKLSLTDRFGRASIKNVLDVATGNGSWMWQPAMDPGCAKSRLSNGQQVMFP